MSIPVYEQLQRAKKGEVFYTTSPARNVTSAASHLKRKVTTEMCVAHPTGHVPTYDSISKVLRVTVKT